VNATASQRMMVERQSVEFMAVLLPCKPQTRSFLVRLPGSVARQKRDLLLSRTYPQIFCAPFITLSQRIDHSVLVIVPLNLWISLLDNLRQNETIERKIG
jgi:hypothetical protein